MYQRVSTAQPSAFITYPITLSSSDLLVPTKCDSFNGKPETGYLG